jgi:hypothetical protein
MAEVATEAAAVIASDDGVILVSGCGTSGRVAFVVATVSAPNPPPTLTVSPTSKRTHLKHPHPHGLLTRHP